MATGAVSSHALPVGGLPRPFRTQTLQLRTRHATPPARRETGDHRLPRGVLHTGQRRHTSIGSIPPVAFEDRHAHHLGTCQHDPHGSCVYRSESAPNREPTPTRRHQSATHSTSRTHTRAQANRRRRRRCHRHRGYPTRTANAAGFITVALTALIHALGHVDLECRRQPEGSPGWSIRLRSTGAALRKQSSCSSLRGYLRRHLLATRHRVAACIAWAPESPSPQVRMNLVAGSSPRPLSTCSTATPSALSSPTGASTRTASGTTASE